MVFFISESNYPHPGAQDHIKLYQSDQKEAWGRVRKKIGNTPRSVNYSPCWMLSDILVMTRDCPSVRILKYLTNLERNPQWRKVEQRASGGSRVRSPDDQEERLPSTQHSWHVSAPMSKIWDPRVSRWEIFALIPRLGYTLRVAWELGLPGVCSLQRLGSADSELQPPVNTLQHWK